MLRFNEDMSYKVKTVNGELILMVLEHRFSWYNEARHDPREKYQYALIAEGPVRPGRGFQEPTPKQHTFLALLHYISERTSYYALSEKEFDDVYEIMNGHRYEEHC